MLLEGSHPPTASSGPASDMEATMTNPRSRHRILIHTDADPMTSTDFFLCQVLFAGFGVQASAKICTYENAGKRTRHTARPPPVSPSLSQTPSSEETTKKTPDFCINTCYEPMDSDQGQKVPTRCSSERKPSPGEMKGLLLLSAVAAASAVQAPTSGAAHSSSLAFAGPFHLAPALSRPSMVLKRSGVGRGRRAQGRASIAPRMGDVFIAEDGRTAEEYIKDIFK